MVTKKGLYVDWCDRRAVDYAVRRWHYSRSVPPPPHNSLGVWEDGVFVGVVLYSRGANKCLVKPYGLSSIQGCELTRVALSKHKSYVSRILSISLKMLKRRSPNLRLVVSFADPEQGHYGGIYQATNWYYAGKTPKSYKYVDARGREWHSRMIKKTGIVPCFGSYRRCLTPEQCKKIQVEGKHRYLYPLDDEMRRAIEPISKPYPKKPKG